MGTRAACHLEQEPGEEDKADEHGSIFQGAFHALIRADFLEEAHAHIAAAIGDDFTKVDIGASPRNATGKIGHTPIGGEAVDAFFSGIVRVRQFSSLETRVFPVAGQGHRRVLGKWADGETVCACDVQAGVDVEGCGCRRQPVDPASGEA